MRDVEIGRRQGALLKSYRQQRWILDSPAFSNSEPWRGQRSSVTSQSDPWVSRFARVLPWWAGGPRFGQQHCSLVSPWYLFPELGFIGHDYAKRSVCLHMTHMNCWASLGAVNRGDYGRIMITIMAPILFDNLGEIRPCLTAQKLTVDYVYDYCCNYVH